MDRVRAGILTASDRCSRGTAEDLGGPALRRLVTERGWDVTVTAIVPDDAAVIASLLREWCDERGVGVVLTTGGTGLGPRDVTPEATRRVLDKELPGVAELMRREGLAHTRMSVLSRAVVGSRGRSLIVNLPGSPRGACQSLESIIDLVEHALAMLAGGGHETPARSAP